MPTLCWVYKGQGEKRSSLTSRSRHKTQDSRQDQDKTKTRLKTQVLAGSAAPSTMDPWPETTQDTRGRTWPQVPDADGPLKGAQESKTRLRPRQADEIDDAVSCYQDRWPFRHWTASRCDERVARCWHQIQDSRPETYFGYRTLEVLHATDITLHCESRVTESESSTYLPQWWNMYWNHITFDVVTLDVVNKNQENQSAVQCTHFIAMLFVYYTT